MTPHHTGNEGPVAGAMDAVGGYFGLELPPAQNLFPGAVALNSARSAFEFILSQSTEGIGTLHLPAYVCPVVLAPLARLGIPWSFYSIAEDLYPDGLSAVSPEDKILVVNYFGVSGHVADSLIRAFPDQVIVDAAQAFYFRPSIAAPTFNSARKFFGVPDGGYALNVPEGDTDLSHDVSDKRCMHLLQRLDEGAEAGYSRFVENELALASVPMRRMSVLTRRMLEGVDHSRCRMQRRANFARIHDSLATCNRLRVRLGGDTVPMVYPLWIPGGRELREHLRSRRIYCAQYWPELPSAGGDASIGEQLRTDLVPLPIDQRYGVQEMAAIAAEVLRWWRT